MGVPRGPDFGTRETTNPSQPTRSKPTKNPGAPSWTRVASAIRVPGGKPQPSPSHFQPIHKVRVPHLRRVFVLAPKMGDHESNSPFSSRHKSPVPHPFDLFLSKGWETTKTNGAKEAVKAISPSCPTSPPRHSIPLQSFQEKSAMRPSKPMVLVFFALASLTAQPPNFRIATDGAEGAVAPTASSAPTASTPPMGWNSWNFFPATSPIRMCATPPTN